ncbi:MAG: DeoR family transcriptional regulator [Leucobacter sp.]
MRDAERPLTPKLRRGYILEQLSQLGRLEVGALAVKIGVAEETIRRDFRRLENDGKLRRAHGGALPLESEMQFASDLGKLQATATPLSAAVAARLPAAGWIYLDGGPDIEGASTLLPEREGMFVVAGSVGSSLGASARDQLSVVSLGGTATGRRGIYTGAWALANLRRYFFDASFLEVQAIASSGELLTSDAAEAAVRRVVLERSRQSVGVWTGEDAPTARVAYGRLSDLDTLIVPRSLDAARLRELGQGASELPTLVYADLEADLEADLDADVEVNMGAETGGVVGPEAWQST